MRFATQHKVLRNMNYFSALTIIASLMFVGIYLYLVKCYTKREGILSTITIFGLGCIVYYMVIPLEMGIRAMKEYSICGVINLDVSPELPLIIILMGLAALISFSIGYFLSNFNPFWYGTAPLSGNRAYFKTPRGLCLIIAGCIMLLLAFYRRDICEMLTYQEAAYARYTNPTPAMLLFLGTSTLALVIGIVAIRSNRRVPLSALPLFSVLVAWGVVSSDKNPIFMAVLGIGALYVSQHRESPKMLIELIGAAVLFIFFSKLFAVYRTIGLAGLLGLSGIPNDAFSFMHFEPAGPFNSIMYLLVRDVDHIFGESYLNLFTVLFPKSLWPTRPLGLGEAFARDVLPSWRPGQGMGYSLLAESYANLSFIGCIFQYFCIGFFWGVFWRIIFSFLSYLHSGARQAIYWTFGYYLLVLMHRGAVAQLSKNVFLFFCPILVFTLIFDYVMPISIGRQISISGGVKDGK
jgi:hypothetical protein